MNKYLKNPLVIFGTLGVMFWLFTRKKKKEVIHTPEIVEEVEEEEEEEENLDGLPQEFIKDVKKMDKKQIKNTLRTNQAMLKRANVDKEKKEMIVKMLDYLKSEYAKR